jgi:hypothetical protein
VRSIGALEPQTIVLNQSAAATHPRKNPAAFDSKILRHPEALKVLPILRVGRLTFGGGGHSLLPHSGTVKIDDWSGQAWLGSTYDEPEDGMKIEILYCPT